MQRLLQRVEDLGAGLQRAAEALEADRDDHELLEVDRVVGVRAAVQHVHHRHGQHVRGLAAEVAPQRQAVLLRGRLGGGQRHAEDRVRAEARLVRRAVEVDHPPVDAAPGRRRRCPRTATAISLVHVRDRARDALAVPGVAAVAQLDGLELAGRRARRHRGAAGRRRT